MKLAEYQKVGALFERERALRISAERQAADFKLKWEQAERRADDRPNSSWGDLYNQRDRWRATAQRMTEQARWYAIVLAGGALPRWSRP